MVDYTFTSLNALSINWINDGSNPNNPYPSGPAIDLSHGENRCCVWTWKVVDAVRAGLVFVKCRRCAANAQVIVGTAGSLRVPCNVNIYPGIPT